MDVKHCYSKTDVFLLCFAVDNMSSLNLLASHYIPQIKKMTQDREVPPLFVLVGCKQDTREHLKNRKLVSVDKAQGTRKDLGLDGYVECSAMSGNGVHDVFHEALKLHFERQEGSHFGQISKPRFRSKSQETRNRGFLSCFMACTSDDGEESLLRK